MPRLDLIKLFVGSLQLPVHVHIRKWLDALRNVTQNKAVQRAFPLPFSVLVLSVSMPQNAKYGLVYL